MPKIPNHNRCPICGGPLPARWASYPLAKFCSYRCRGIAKRGKAAWNKGLLQSTRKPRPPCKTCGKPVKQGRKFCCRACYFAWTRGRKRPLKYRGSRPGPQPRRTKNRIRTCPTCGQRFRYPHTNPRQQYCSNVCWLRSRSRKLLLSTYSTQPLAERSAPKPFEIANRAAAIRATWTDGQRFDDED